MDEPPVTPEELAMEIFLATRSSRHVSWEDFKAGPLGSDAIWRARRILNALSDRRLTDAQQRAIRRLESAAHRVAEEAADAVHEALAVCDPHSDTAQDARLEGILYALDQIAKRSGVDEIAGIGPVSDALRTLRREALPPGVR